MRCGCPVADVRSALDATDVYVAAGQQPRHYAPPQALDLRQTLSTRCTRVVEQTRLQHMDVIPTLFPGPLWDPSALTRRDSGLWSVSLSAVGGDCFPGVALPDSKNGRVCRQLVLTAWTLTGSSCFLHGQLLLDSRTRSWRFTSFFHVFPP